MRKISEKYEKCHIGNILVAVVPEGCIYEIKLVALVLKHISQYSPTNEIWAPLLRGQSTVAMDIFLPLHFNFKIRAKPYQML